MKKNLLKIFLALAIFILLYRTVALAQEEQEDLQMVEAQGSASVINNNLARAQEEAVRDALRKAVEKVAGRWLSSGDRVRKASALKKSIYSEADKYVQTYKITSETPSQAIFTVNLNAAVDVGALKDDLQSLGFLSLQRRDETVTLSLTVRGIYNYEDYTRFIELLKSGMAGVKNVQVRQVEWSMVRMDVDTEGSVQTLVDRLGKTGKFSFDIQRMEANLLEITLLDKEKITNW